MHGSNHFLHHGLWRTSTRPVNSIDTCMEATIFSTMGYGGHRLGLSSQVTHTNIYRSCVWKACSHWSRGQRRLPGCCPTSRGVPGPSSQLYAWLQELLLDALMYLSQTPEENTMHLSQTPEKSAMLMHGMPSAAGDSCLTHMHSAVWNLRLIHMLTRRSCYWRRSCT